MGALEQLNQLRSQGFPDESIMQNLKEKGFSPKEINDAFNQSQIKQAVSDDYPEPPKSPEYQEEDYNQNQQAGGNLQEAQNQGDVYYPQPQGNYSPQYQGQEDYYAPGNFDTSTIIEISEQVVSEKMHDIQKKIDDLSELGSLMKTRVDGILERVKNMEKIIDSLQVSILQKVGSYGGNIEGIKKEMSMMQDSFRKMVPSLARHAEARMQRQPKETRKSTPKKTQKGKKIRKKII